MSTARRLLLGVTLAATTGGLCFSGDPARKAEIVKKPPAWDAEAAAAFARAGIPVPRTVMTVETDAPLDLAWIREAFGYAHPLSAKEVQAIEQLGRSNRELGRSGSLGAPGGVRGGRRRLRTRRAPPRAPSPRPAPTTARPDSDDARRPQQGSGNAAPPRPPAAEPARPEGRRAARLEERSRSREAENLDGGGGGPAGPAESPARRGFAGDKAKKQAESKGGEVPKPVLSDVKTAPRLAKLLFRNARGKMESLVPRGMRVVTFI